MKVDGSNIFVINHKYKKWYYILWL